MRSTRPAAWRSQQVVLVEAFKDDAGSDHVDSEHFRRAVADMPQALVETPRIISRKFDGEGSEPIGELAMSPPSSRIDCSGTALLKPRPAPPKTGGLVERPMWS